MTRPKEIAFPHYPHRDAKCSCEPTHTWDGVPCISVRRADGTDRCMECNTRWPVAGQASLDLSVPCPRYAERGAPCVPFKGVCAYCGNAARAA